jgi:hypothetical protein
VLDPIEQLFLRMAQPYFQDVPTIRERDFVRTLADMIVGLLEDRGDGRRRSRK